MQCNYSSAPWLNIDVLHVVPSASLWSCSNIWMFSLIVHRRGILNGWWLFKWMVGWGYIPCALCTHPFHRNSSCTAIFDLVCASLVVCVTVYSTLKRVRPLLSHFPCVTGPCAAVVRETLCQHRLNFHHWIRTEYFNKPHSPQLLCVCVCVCVLCAVTAWVIWFFWQVCIHTIDLARESWSRRKGNAVKVVTTEAASRESKEAQSLQLSTKPVLWIKSSFLSQTARAHPTRDSHSVLLSLCHCREYGLGTVSCSVCLFHTLPHPPHLLSSISTAFFPLSPYSCFFSLSLLPAVLNSEQQPEENGC